MASSQEAAETLAAMAPQAEETDTQPAKRQRKGKLEAAQAAVVREQAAVSEAQGKIAVLESGPLKAADRKKLETLQKRLSKHKAELVQATSNLQAVQEKKAADAAAAEKKAARDLATAEANRPLSEAGQEVLTELRMQFDHKFNNTSDKAEAVWAHVHKEFSAAVDKGQLPESDRRSVTALTRRYALEYGEFKLWCSIANRAIHESGVPADQVEERVEAHRRKSTHIFLKYGFAGRPMSAPEWQISSDTAAAGGMGNCLPSTNKQKPNSTPKPNGKERSSKPKGKERSSAAEEEGSEPPSGCDDDDDSDGDGGNYNFNFSEAGLGGFEGGNMFPNGESEGSGGSGGGGDGVIGHATASAAKGAGGSANDTCRSTRTPSPVPLPNLHIGGGESGRPPKPTETKKASSTAEVLLAISPPLQVHACTYVCVHTPTAAPTHRHSSISLTSSRHSWKHSESMRRSWWENALCSSSYTPMSLGNPLWVGIPLLLPHLLEPWQPPLGGYTIWVGARKGVRAARQWCEPERGLWGKGSLCGTQ